VFWIDAHRSEPATLLAVLSLRNLANQQLVVFPAGWLSHTEQYPFSTVVITASHIWTRQQHPQWPAGGFFYAHRLFSSSLVNCNYEWRSATRSWRRCAVRYVGRRTHYAA